MIAVSVIGAFYLGQLLLKTALAERYARLRRTDQALSSNTSVTIVQPILGGDPLLSATLDATVRALPDANFLWLIDTDDPVGLAVCTALAEQHARRNLRLLRCPPPAQGENPKAVKLARGLDEITTAEFVVLDDDTRLSSAALAALQAGLAQGATLATGLPRYRPAQGRWSSWLAEFVNSAAVLTYLPPLAFADPLSIHGMCYAMRTDDARRLDVFRRIARSLTDDLALALLVRGEGLRLHQTIVPHDIATSVADLGALRRILHRWFVFTRLLVDAQTWQRQLALLIAFGLPPLLLVALIGCAMVDLRAGTAGLIVLVLRWATLRFIKRRFLGRGVVDHPLASLLLELAQPVLLVCAYASNVVQWRRRTIRVHTVDRFDYV